MKPLYSTWKSWSLPALLLCAQIALLSCATTDRPSQVQPGCSRQDIERLTQQWHIGPGSIEWFTQEYWGLRWSRPHGYAYVEVRFGEDNRVAEVVERREFEEAEAFSAYLTQRKVLRQEELSQRISDQKRRGRQAYVNDHPGTDTRIATLIVEGKIGTGMSEEEVKASWGPPKAVNRSAGSFGTTAQWVYPGKGFSDTYLYFRDDELTSWQFTE